LFGYLLLIALDFKASASSLLELPNQQISSFDKAEGAATMVHLRISLPLASLSLSLVASRFFPLKDLLLQGH